MSSPEPRSRSHSTAGAGGSSGALIGPSARRRRGLWGNPAGAGGGAAEGHWRGVRPCSPAWQGSRAGSRACSASAPLGSRSGAGTGRANLRRCGAPLPLYRPGGDPDTAPDVTAAAEGGGGRPQGGGATPGHLSPSAHSPQERETEPQLRAERFPILISGRDGVWELVSDSPNFSNHLKNLFIYTLVDLNLITNRD